MRSPLPTGSNPDLSRAVRSKRAAAAAIASLCVLATGASISVAAPTNINLSARSGNQVEGAIAVNPSNPSQIYAVAMNAAPAGGLVSARSSDGGASWTRGTVAPPGEGMPAAASDPSLSWDSYGNLFLSYINLVKSGSKWAQVLAISTNGGATFKFLTALASLPDQPTVTTGPSSTPGTGSVWVSWAGANGYMYASGAPVTGLGSVGAFQTSQVPGTFGLSYGDIAVGPSGQVILSAGPAAPGSIGGSIVTSLSSGLGGAFSEAGAATTTGVGGFESIPAQPTRGVDSESGLAYDRSGGPHNGRVYLVYNDVSPAGSPALEVYVRHSDNNGSTWSEPVKVNDGATGPSHFLPRLALDQGTGIVGVTWYDTRNDPANVQTQLFGSFSTDGGETFTPNVQISAGTSNEAGGDPAPAGYPDLDYGDYTGSTFAGGRLFPIWADNSNSTGDNPNGPLSSFDVYTAGVPAPAAPPTAPVVKIELTTPTGTGWYTAVPVEGKVTAIDPSAEPYPITEVSCAGASVGAVSGLGTQTASATIAVSRQGTGSVTCSASDTALLTGESTPTEVKLDSAPPQLAPAITPPVSPILIGGTATAEPHATDALLEGFASGIATATCGSLETAVAGAKSVGCEAADVAGNRAEARLPYIVGYGITIITPKSERRYRAGSRIGTSMQLTAANGQPIPSRLARSLGCSVTVSFANGTPECASYTTARQNTFRALLPVPPGTTPGTYPVVFNVTVAGVSVATRTVTVTIHA